MPFLVINVIVHFFIFFSIAGMWDLCTTLHRQRKRHSELDSESIVTKSLKPRVGKENYVSKILVNSGDIANVVK